MMRRVFYIFSIIGLFSLMLMHPSYLQAGQGNGHFRTFKKAMAAAGEKNYEKAMALYEEILKESPDHIDALTQLGVCMINTNHSPDSALALFYKVLDLIPRADHFSKFGTELYHIIAHTYNLNQKPEKGLEILKMLKDSVKDENLRATIIRDIAQTRNAAVLLKNPVPLRIINLGESINSEYDDHSPLISLAGNRIFFTSRRPVGKDPKLDDGQYPEKVFSAEYDGEGWKNPKRIGEFFSRWEHKSILSLSPDGRQIFLFKNDRGVKNIYFSRYRNGEWQEPEKLPAPVNSKWDETHASLSPDQSTLYFTSNRPGGYGGLDIYRVKKNEYGEWGEAKNLGPYINSDLDEETPMLHPDGCTLYFASKGHSSMGGFDVFYSQAQEDIGGWTKPVNMGHPINTPDDDFFFVPTIDKSKAYYSSYRFSENIGRSDLYRVEFDSTYSGSLAVIEGTIKNSNDLPSDHIRILVSRESDNKVVGDYRPNPETGKYLLFLETGESYTIKEVSPEGVEEKKNINVSKQLAYVKADQVVMVQDPRMIPPLKPGLFPNEINTSSLAEVHPKKQKRRDFVLKPEMVAELNPPVANAVYTLQILALKHYPRVGLWFFNGLERDSVNAMQGQDGYLRYVTGRFDSIEAAREYREKIQKDGRFNDAWIRQLGPLKEMTENEKLLLTER